MQIYSREDLLVCRRDELAPGDPQVSQTGIEGLMEYRINYNTTGSVSLFREYDKTSHKYSGKSRTAEYCEILYGIDPFDIGCIDTIFNCWSYLRRFFMGMAPEFWPDEPMIKDSLDYIFDGYEGIRRKLDKLADYQYCLANLMPVPVGFIGSRSYDGKGNRTRDNGMPDLYYKRARNDFPRIRQWIDENMEKYSLEVFREYESYCEDGHADDPVTDDPVDWVPFERSIDNAIACIEYRSMKMINMFYKREVS